jgi:hypothetical protein
MTDLQLKNVEGWKTRVDPLGKLQHEKLGVSELTFSNDHFQFADLIVPYQKAEDPKLHVDRLFLKNWTRFDTILLNTQYTFVMRVKLKQLQEIPLPFKTTINRRIWMNLVFAYMGIQLVLFLSWVINKWLLK